MFLCILFGIAAGSTPSHDVKIEDDWQNRFAAICWRICHYGPVCPKNCPESLLGSWPKRSIDGGQRLSLDDYDWFMKLLGRNLSK
ncbi:hypothetical protein ScPMuIL_013082 [Solemya velum]